MSSPPGGATSPTYPGSLNLPRKRPSLATPGPGGSVKRRKPSEASSASHPLRQTSFPPPEGFDVAIEPSRHSSFSPTTSSIGPGSKLGRGKKKRGRKGGAGKGGDGEGSVIKGVTGWSAKDGEGASRVGRELDEEPEDDEGDAYGDLMYDGGEKMDEAAKKQEREHMA